MGTWPQSVSGGKGDSLQNVGFAGITFRHKIPVATNGGKVLTLFPVSFPLSLKLKGRVSTTAFCCSLPHSYVHEHRLLTDSHQNFQHFLYLCVCIICIKMS